MTQGVSRAIPLADAFIYGEVKMATLDNMPETVSELFKDVRSGARDLVTGIDKVDIGRGVVTSAMLLICAADAEYRSQMVARAYSLVTKRTDENKQEVDAARVYFRDMLVKEDSDTATRLTQKDEPDRMSRDRHNNKAQALDAAATFAAYCIIAEDHVKVWQSLSAPRVKANKGSVNMTLDGVSIMWPDRKKSLENMEQTFVTISNRAGAWRMSSLETIGKAVAEMKGLRAAAKTKATPVRDAAAIAVNSLEANDIKTINSSVENRLALFTLAVSVIDTLNDKTFVDHIGNDVVAPFRERVVALLDKAQQEKDAKVTPAAAS